jgi:hypothetical protein
MMSSKSSDRTFVELEHWFGCPAQQADDIVPHTDRTRLLTVHTHLLSAFGFDY